MSYEEKDSQGRGKKGGVEAQRETLFCTHPPIIIDGGSVTLDVHHPRYVKLTKGLYAIQNVKVTHITIVDHNTSTPTTIPVQGACVITTRCKMAGEEKDITVRGEASFGMVQTTFDEDNYPETGPGTKVHRNASFKIVALDIQDQNGHHP